MKTSVSENISRSSSSNSLPLSPYLKPRSGPTDDCLNFQFAYLEEKWYQKTELVLVAPNSYKKWNDGLLQEITMVTSEDFNAHLCNGLFDTVIFATVFATAWNDVPQEIISISSRSPSVPPYDRKDRSYKTFTVWYYSEILLTAWWHLTIIGNDIIILTSSTVWSRLCVALFD